MSLAPQSRVVLLVFVILLLSSETFAQDAVDIAVDQIGDAYSWGWNGPDIFDCSGLTSYSYGQIGVMLPRTALAQSEFGELLKDNYQRGDLIFFATDDDRPDVVTHVGIYEGDNILINANSVAGKVRRNDISTPYWTERLLFARRVVSPPDEPITIVIDGDPVEWTEAGIIPIIIDPIGNELFPSYPDIVSIRVTHDINFVYFLFEIENLKSPTFSLPLLGIYLDVDLDNSTGCPFPGDGGHEFLIDFDSISVSEIREADETSCSYDFNYGVLSYVMRGNFIEASIPISVLENQNQNLTAIQVTCGYVGTCTPGVYRLKEE